MTIILRGEASTYHDLLEPGDALNATGRVERRDGALAVIVEAAAGLVRVGDLGETLPLGTRQGAAASRPAATDGLAGPALADAGRGFPGGLPIGLSGLVAISILSVAVTVFRRRTALARAMVAARERLAELNWDDRSA